TNSRLNLIYNGTKSAQIAPILDGAIIGQIRFEHRITASIAGWLNIGSPASDATLLEWNDDFITTGFEGSDYPEYSFVNVQQYIESAETDAASYSVATSTDEMINPGEGYYVYVNPGTFLFDLQGTPNQGDFTFDVSYTDYDDAINDGLNLLANPYPATINWESTTGWDKSNIYDALYIWDVNEKQFRTYINGYGVNGGSPRIKSSETFWVQAFDSSPTLSLSETAKDLSTNPIANTQENYLSIRFTNGTDNDEIMVVFDNDASDSFDPGRDALKFKSPSSGINVGTKSDDGTLLAINTTTTGNSYHIPVSLDILNAGPYSMIIEHLPNAEESFCIGLQDNESGIIQAISEGQVIDFNSPEVLDYVRFDLVIDPPVTASATSAVCYGEANGTFTTEGIGSGPFDYFFADSLGTSIASFEGVEGAQTLEGLEAGTYSVVIDGNHICDGLHTEVEILQSTPFSFDSGITALECGETDTGRIMAVPEGGESPYQFYIDGEPSPQLTEGLAADTYLVSVIDALGCEMSEMVEVTGPMNVEASFTSNSQLETLENGAANFEFTNTTSGGDFHMWDFGDGLGTIGENASHSYSNPGFYQVTLSSSNEECDDEFVMVVQVEQGPDNVLENSFENVSVAYIQDKIIVQLGETASLLKQINIYNHLGQLIEVESGSFDTQTTLDFNGVTGMYIITLDFGSVVKHYKVVQN
ncbi:MAG: PKD domain-containing protein, partial [Flavobacteriales bacterium]